MFISSTRNRGRPNGIRAGARRAAVPLIALYAAAGAGCEEKSRSAAEIAAGAEARAVLAGTTGEDVVTCSGANVRVGKMISLKRETRPTVLVDIEQRRTPKSRYGWYLGKTVGKYSAEIMWTNPSLAVTHEIKGAKDDHSAIILPGIIALNGPNLDLDGLSLDGRDPTLSFDGRRTVVIPLNRNFPGTRRVTVESRSYRVFLSESYDGRLQQNEPPIRGLESDCKTFDVFVPPENDKDITILK